MCQLLSLVAGFVEFLQSSVSGSGRRSPHEGSWFQLGHPDTVRVPNSSCNIVSLLIPAFRFKHYAFFTKPRQAPGEKTLHSVQSRNMEWKKVSHGNTAHNSF
jgi:hypothetical protein